MKRRFFIRLCLYLMLISRLHGLAPAQNMAGEHGRLVGREGQTSTVHQHLRDRSDQHMLERQIPSDALLYPYPKFLTGNRPQAIVVSDLNRDGALDLVTPNEFSATPSDHGDVSVLLGVGDGTFQPQQRFAVGFKPASVAIGDLNGDNVPDIVTANRFPNDRSLELQGLSDVSVLLGAGDGTFQPERRFLTGRSPVAIVLADFNSDRILDIATANRVSSNSGISHISVLLGIGDGTFQSEQRSNLDKEPISMAVGDLNGDGIVDLVTTNDFPEDISVLLGNGDGTLQAPRHYAAGQRPNSILVVDLNGDGALDLVTDNQQLADITVLLGVGDGSFPAPQMYDLFRLDGPSSVAVADIDGNAVLDLVMAFETAGVVVLPGVGDGTFATPPMFVAPLAFPLSGNANDIAVADVSGDSNLDVITANTSSDDISVLPGMGDGTFLAPPPIIPVADLAIADLNHDNILDIVSVSDGINVETVWVLLGLGDGTFHIQPYSLALNNRPTWVAVVDLNGDRHLDIVTTNEGINDVAVLLGLGGGTFQLPQFIELGAAEILAAIADLNGDGRLDMVLSSDRSGDIRVLLGVGDGTFQSQLRFDLAAFDVSAMMVMDLNGDGKPDILTANRGDHDISVLLGNGDGTLQPPQRFAVGDQPQLLTIVDLNQDGALDIVVGNKSSSVSVLLGVGDATFQPEKRFSVEMAPLARIAEPVWLEVVDLNRDGNLDIVTVNDGSEDVSILLGDGSGEFERLQTFAVGVDPESGAVADLNGDGLLDIVSANSGSRDLSVLLGLGDGTLRVQQRFAAGAGVHRVWVAELNGDNAPDLITPGSVLLHR